MRIWTVGYRPFIMGGNVNAPVCIETEATGPFDLGKGWKGYVVVAPSGKTFVAESITGAIVGSTIEEVRADVATAAESIMIRQIEDAKKRAAEAEAVSADVFWRQLKGARA